MQHQRQTASGGDAPSGTLNAHHNNAFMSPTSESHIIAQSFIKQDGEASGIPVLARSIEPTNATVDVSPTWTSGLPTDLLHTFAQQQEPVASSALCIRRRPSISAPEFLDLERLHNSMSTHNLPHATAAHGLPHFPFTAHALPPMARLGDSHTEQQEVGLPPSSGSRAPGFDYRPPNTKTSPNRLSAATHRLSLSPRLHASNDAARYSLAEEHVILDHRGPRDSGLPPSQRISSSDDPTATGSLFFGFDSEQHARMVQSRKLRRVSRDSALNKSSRVAHRDPLTESGVAWQSSPIQHDPRQAYHFTSSPQLSLRKSPRLRREKAASESALALPGRSDLTEAATVSFLPQASTTITNSNQHKDLDALQADPLSAPQQQLMHEDNPDSGMLGSHHLRDLPPAKKAPAPKPGRPVSLSANEVGQGGERTSCEQAASLPRSRCWATVERLSQQAVEADPLTLSAPHPSYRSDVDKEQHARTQRTPQYATQAASAAQTPMAHPSMHTQGRPAPLGGWLAHASNPSSTSLLAISAHPEEALGPGLNRPASIQAGLQVLQRRDHAYHLGQAQQHQQHQPHQSHQPHQATLLSEADMQTAGPNALIASPLDVFVSGLSLTASLPSPLLHQVLADASRSLMSSIATQALLGGTISQAGTYQGMLAQPTFTFTSSVPGLGPQFETAEMHTRAAVSIAHLGHTHACDTDHYRTGGVILGPHTTGTATPSAPFFPISVGSVLAGPAFCQAPVLIPLDAHTYHGPDGVPPTAGFPSFDEHLLRLLPTLSGGGDGLGGLIVSTACRQEDGTLGQKSDGVAHEDVIEEKSHGDNAESHAHEPRTAAATSAALATAGKGREGYRYAQKDHHSRSRRQSERSAAAMARARMEREESAGESEDGEYHEGDDVHAPRRGHQRHGRSNGRSSRVTADARKGVRASKRGAAAPAQAVEFFGSKTPLKRVFVCEVCGFQCNDSGNIVRHRRRHGGDRPYKCGHCDRDFINSSNRRKHERSCLRRILDYQCQTAAGDAQEAEWPSHADPQASLLTEQEDHMDQIMLYGPPAHVDSTSVEATMPVAGSLLGAEIADEERGARASPSLASGSLVRPRGARMGPSAVSHQLRRGLPSEGDQGEESAGIHAAHDGQQEC
jgi:hypothetical protein